MSPPIKDFVAGDRPFLLQLPKCIGRAAARCSKEALLERAGGEAETPAQEAPEDLHSAFDPLEVKPWTPGQFEMLGKVQDALRNHGQVFRMRDRTSGDLVAVKLMPNDWVRSCHSEFVKAYPAETEQPWRDIGCNSFLSKVGYPYCCRLRGVYRGEEDTAVVMELASEGDLFSWCGASTGAPPGLERERQLRPLAGQIFRAVQELHGLSVVHRDLSLENLVLSGGAGGGGGLRVRVIDFGMASTSRFSSSMSGKFSYQAPEIHSGDAEYDGFLSDAFAVGVVLYAAFMKDFPWLSTRPGGCKCFEFYRRHGFRKYIAKRKVRGGSGTVASVMSHELQSLLEGLLAIDPAQRLTLGEGAWDAARRSVWDEPWPKEGPVEAPAGALRG